MLVLRDADAEVRIAPARAGIVTSFRIGEGPILFLDEATLSEPTKSVRGGIPVLFPTPGKLTNDQWTWGGRTGRLPQHGFARTLPFTPRPSDDGLRLALVWPGDEHWPWPCTLEIELGLRGRTLRFEQHVRNEGDEPMLFGLGFHPYFFVPEGDKRSARIRTSATRAFDNVAKQSVALGPLDLTAPEVDLHLLDHGSSTASLQLRAKISSCQRRARRSRCG